MDIFEFVGLRCDGDRLVGRFDVNTAICGSQGNLWGGVGFAAPIAMLERVCERPVLWATAHFLNSIRAGSAVTFECVIEHAGRSVTQASARGLVDGKPAITVALALGQRLDDRRLVTPAMPEVPRPDECPPRVWRVADSITQRMDMRIANGRYLADLDGVGSVDGRSAFWARLHGIDEMSAAAIAVVADTVPHAIAQATGRKSGGASLDNTLRMFTSLPTDWVLLDCHVYAISNGFGHGDVRVWSEDGTLLGIASQSVAIRYDE